MWYFSWILGLGFAVLLAILNAMWGEFEQDRTESISKNKQHGEGDHDDSDV